MLNRKILISSYVLLLLATEGLADLQIFPTRVLLTDQKRTAHISLRHLGNTVGEYRVTAVFYRMGFNGAMELIQSPKPEENSAIKFLRFSPRQVSLPPRLEQILRVTALAPSNLPEGDYRAHLFFEPLSSETPIKGKQSDGVNMQLQAKLAVAVPVVFRHGSKVTKASLSQLKFVKLPDGSPGYSARLARAGKGFLYGDLRATFVPKEGNPQEVGFVAGVSSYLDEREVQFPLKLQNGLVLKHGTLRLEFRDPSEGGGKTLAFIEESIQ